MSADRTPEGLPGKEPTAVEQRKQAVLDVLAEYDGHRAFLAAIADQDDKVNSSNAIAYMQALLEVRPDSLRERLSNLLMGQELIVNGRLDLYPSLGQETNQVDFNGPVRVTAVTVDGRSGNQDPYLVPILEVVDENSNPYPMILRTDFFERGPEWQFAPEIDVTDRTLAQYPTKTGSN